MQKSTQLSEVVKEIYTDELKQPIRYRDDIGDLSEWEAARLNSKTWSMEQE